jgi:hypothetical protein
MGIGSVEKFMELVGLKSDEKGLMICPDIL